MTKNSIFLSILATGLLFVACQQTAKEESAPHDDSSLEAAGATVPEAAQNAAGVEYEPAYPADVSSEGLNSDDVAQQQPEHSHEDGAEHAPDQEEAGGHSHGEEGAHGDHHH